MNRTLLTTHNVTTFLIQGRSTANEFATWQTLDELETREVAQDEVLLMRVQYEANPQHAVVLRLVEKVETITYTELKDESDATAQDRIKASQIVPLKKIVSGGQSGVEIVALAVAKAAGIETAGFMLKNFHDGSYGPCPERATEYGLSEHNSSNAGDQTRKNCGLADGTLWIMEGRGSLVAGSFAYNTGHPYLKLTEYDLYDLDIALAKVQCWLVQHRIETLHISGQQYVPHPHGAEQQAAIKNLFTMLFAKPK